jgi:L-lactate dehydrogenase
MKVSVIGTGMVGATLAYRLFISSLPSEIVLVDMNEKRARAEADELRHSLSLEDNVKITDGDYSKIKDSDFVVISAGAPQKTGETRMDLIGTNAKIISDISKKVAEFAPNSIIIVATNPMDVMTYVALKSSGFPKNRVIGTGTILDSSRFKFYLSEFLESNPKDIFAFILGEHGDSQVGIFSHISIKGIPMENFCSELGKCLSQNDKNQILKKTKESAYSIIEGKGSTYYAIASSVLKIIKSVWRDEGTILPISSYLEGEYGFDGVCLSVPSVLSKGGIEKVLDFNLDDIEYQKLKSSYEIVKGYCKGL